jgi:hypothetical protein
MQRHGSLKSNINAKVAATILQKISRPVQWRIELQSLPGRCGERTLGERGVLKNQAVQNESGSHVVGRRERHVAAEH